MYERLLDKSSEPTPEQIQNHLGAESCERLVQLKNYLQLHYRLSREMRFPFGNSYGWGYKFSHGSAHLCYVFFEREAFTVTLQIGDKQVPALEGVMTSLSSKARELWLNRYPCGDKGGWIHFRILSDEDLKDVFRLIRVRKKGAA